MNKMLEMMALEIVKMAKTPETFTFMQQQSKAGNNGQNQLLENSSN